jgi:peptidoglycan biosynthesis protein MviN/MurJ (putative lipid II flippase)
VNAVTVLLASLNTVLSSVFQLLVVYRLGVGGRSDLYYAATIATVVVFTIFLDPLSNVLIPMFVERASNQSDERRNLLWNSMLVVFAGGLAIVLVIYFPIRLIFPLIFKSLRWASPGEVGKIVISYSLYQMLFGAITVKNCYLFASGKPAAAQLNLLVSWIISLILLSQVNIAGDVSRIAYCLVVGNAVGLILPNLDRWTLNYREGHFRSHVSALIQRAGPLTSGSAVFRAESLLDGAISSFFGAGSLTVYQLFSRMLLSISTIINSGYIQPVTKHLAEAAGQERWDALRRQARSSAFWSSAASLACLVPLVPIFLFLHARPIRVLDIYVRLFERYYAVFLLMLGYLVGSLIWKVYATGLIVLRRERLFAFLCVATFLAGVIFKIFGAYSAGLAGLALGTSIYWILGAASMAGGFWKSLRANRSMTWARSPELSSEIVPKFGSAD